MNKMLTNISILSFDLCLKVIEILYMLFELVTKVTEVTEVLINLGDKNCKLEIKLFFCLNYCFYCYYSNHVTELLH